MLPARAEEPSASIHSKKFHRKLKGIDFGGICMRIFQNNARK